MRRLQPLTQNVRVSLRIVLLLTVTALVAGGCASSTSEGEDTAELCQNYERFGELDDELLAPEVFDLSADELEVVLAERRDIASWSRPQRPS